MTVHAQETDLLTLKFLAGCVERGVSLSVKGPVVRLVEVLAHFVVQIVVWVVQVIYHLVEEGLAAGITEGRTLFFFEV